MTDLGKKGSIYVVRANGEVRKVRKSNSSAVNAGTEIFVVEGERRERNPNIGLTAMTASASLMMAMVAIFGLILK